MKRLLLPVFVLLLIGAGQPAWAGMYDLQKLTDGVYAAVATPGSKATSNALVIVTKYQVMIAGAHFVAEGIKDLVVEIAEITPLPVRYVILTHHHRGFNYVDFDFPANVELVTTWQGAQALKSEYRDVKNPVTYFDKGLTLIREGRSIILSNLDAGHSSGDLILYLPEDKILFASDLLFVDEIGYMGDGHMRDWILNLEMMDKLDVKTVVPGVGPVVDKSGIRRFLNFFKDFMSELLVYSQKGATLDVVEKKFSLDGYKNMKGYDTFMKANIKQAYKELLEK